MSISDLAKTFRIKHGQSSETNMLFYLNEKQRQEIIKQRQKQEKGCL